MSVAAPKVPGRFNTIQGFTKHKAPLPGWNPRNPEHAALQHSEVYATMNIFTVNIYVYVPVYELVFHKSPLTFINTGFGQSEYASSTQASFFGWT